MAIGLSTRIKIHFCAIGADRAFEQVNRYMKVSGRLAGITLEPRSRTRFFRVAPELAGLAGEALEMTGLPNMKTMHHHELHCQSCNNKRKMLETWLIQSLSLATPLQMNMTC